VRQFGLVEAAGRRGCAAAQGTHRLRTGRIVVSLPPANLSRRSAAGRVEIAIKLFADMDQSAATVAGPPTAASAMASEERQVLALFRQLPDPCKAVVHNLLRRSNGFRIDPALLERAEK
jgi:hypothetical protein